MVISLDIMLMISFPLLQNDDVCVCSSRKHILTTKSIDKLSLKDFEQQTETELQEQFPKYRDATQYLVLFSNQRRA
ncbi:hypothetical protein Gasu2_56780 [Galdieria sulphuraria]|nr:hypothetical protein Gasu2_56780 [Galdieria sulphuraria]